MERCPDPRPDCFYADTALCGLSRHHRFWPRDDYRTKLERAFRNHPGNIDLLPNCQHRELHLTTKPPEKPPGSQMAAFLLRSGDDLPEPGHQLG